MLRPRLPICSPYFDPRADDSFRSQQRGGRPSPLHAAARQPETQSVRTAFLFPFATAFTWALASPLAGAGEYSILNEDRTVTAHALAGTCPFACDENSASATAPPGAFFDTTRSADAVVISGGSPAGSDASASAQQTSMMTQFTLEASGEVAAACSVFPSPDGGPPATADCESRYIINFTLATACSFRLSALLHVDEVFDDATAQATVDLASATRSDVFFHVIADGFLAPAANINEIVTGSLPPGEYTLSVTANAMANPVSPNDNNARATFDVLLSFCPADINGDGVVNAADLNQVLGAWGPNPSISDLNGDGKVNAIDLAALLGSWGAC